MCLHVCCCVCVCVFKCPSMYCVQCWCRRGRVVGVSPSASLCALCASHVVCMYVVCIVWVYVCCCGVCVCACLRCVACVGGAVTTPTELDSADVTLLDEIGHGAHPTKPLIYTHVHRIRTPNTYKAYCVTHSYAQVCTRAHVCTRT
eukprot:m.1508013 g.1508013  ORF g.1508013 m.1508013 type:complete len:146 (-) comp25209_c0_seq139:4230-4667(-)